MSGRFTSDEEVAAVKAKWVRTGRWMTPTDEAKRAMAEQYRRGESTYTLSEMYGVSEVTTGVWLKDVGQPIRSASQAAKQRPLHRIYALNEDAFSQVNEHSAYWIGFLMADGCISRGPKGQHVLYLGVNEIDERHIRKFAAFLGTNKPIETRTKALRKDGTPTVMTCIQISSDRLTDALARHGIVPRKSLTAKVSGLEMNRDFWRGVVDGDGCLRFVNNSASLVLAGSENLTRQFFEFCESLGIEPRETSRRPRRGNVWSVCLCGNRAIKVVSHLYGGSTVYLDRKREKAGQIMARAKGRWPARDR